MKRKARTTKRARKQEEYLTNVESAFEVPFGESRTRRLAKSQILDEVNRLMSKYNEMGLTAVPASDDRKTFFDMETRTLRPMVDRLANVLASATRERVALSRTSIFTKLFPK